MKKWWVYVIAGYMLALITHTGLANNETVPVALPAPTVTPSIAAPYELVIPTLQVRAVIEQVANDDEGRMDVPKDAVNVGWYKPGAKPGEAGKAVIDGHFDTPYGPSVFNQLSALKTGDELIINDEAGISRTFVVYDSRNYSDDEFPILDVFGTDPLKKLNLITCDGVFNSNEKNYSHRLVIFSILKEDTP